MPPNVGQGYGLADHLPMIEWYRIGKGYRISNNQPLL
jgi:hypothetical protein